MQKHSVGAGRTARWPWWPWFAAILALVLLPLGGRRWLGDPRSGSDVPVRDAPDSIPAAVPRPVWSPVDAEAITSVIDFAIAGDTLLVLDALSQRVALLRLEGDAWRPLRTIGRKGGGPGEFFRPRSLSLIGDSAFAVLEENGRLQIFGRDGTHHVTEAPSLPCPMFAPSLAIGADGQRFVAGNCTGPGASRDTVFTVLFARNDRSTQGAAESRTVSDTGLIAAVTDSIRWRELARVPRMALDLSWGSVFATLNPLSRHGDMLYFGTGLTGCLTRLSMQPDASTAALPTDACGMVTEAFHVEPPERLVARHRAAKEKGDRRLERATEWPEVMPAYMSVVPAGDSVLLVRPVGVDILAIVPASHPFSPADVRLVAPMDSFVTCTSGACLWYDAERGAIALVSFDADGNAVQRGARLR